MIIICENCIRQAREAHLAAVADAMAHCDARGVPEDSIYRGIIDVEIACREQPMLGELFSAMWPNPAALTQ